VPPLLWSDLSRPVIDRPQAADEGSPTRVHLSRCPLLCIQSCLRESGSNAFKSRRGPVTLFTLDLLPNGPDEAE
jgi:hypothetical protein